MRKLLLIIPILLSVSCLKKTAPPAAAAAPTTTPPETLQEPIGVSATVNSGVQISLSWTSGGGTTSGYRIAYQTGATAPGTCALGTTVNESSITGTSKAINSLALGTQYSFRICSINANTPADVSSGVTVTATTFSAPVAAPPNPTGVTATVNSDVKITLSWTSGGGTTTGYRIAYQTGAAAPATCALGTTISENSITGTSKVLSTLTAGTQYSFRVCAINANAVPDVSSGTTVTATTLFAAPPNPTGLTLTINSTTQITLSWTSGGGTTSGYRIAYQSGATAPEICALGTTIDESSIVGTSKAISGLSMGTQYSFRVCAINANTTPDVSSGVIGTAITLYSAPPDPTGLSATVKSTMQITLSWTSGGGTTAGYRIAYQAGAVAPATCALGTTIGEGAISGTSKAISGLVGGAQYSFRVCAINANTSPDVSSGVTLSETATGPFVSIWRTTAASESVTLPLRVGFTYNFTVNWGDGTATSTVTAFDDPDITHTYASAGLHTITISGVAQSWYFNGAGSNLKIIQVTDLGDVGWTSLQAAFNGCTNLTTFAGGATAAVTDMSQMFFGASSLATMNLSSFNTGIVTDLSQMFFNTSALTSVSLSGFNTANVTSMAGMFNGASTLASLDLSSFNTTNVTNMGQMFNGASALTALDLSNFNTANVTDMGQMFSGTTHLTTLDLTSFDTANVTNMASMFSGASALTTLDLSNFNTGLVTNMGWMFSNTSSLASLDLSTFDTANVTNMREMFSGASALTTLDLSSFVTSNVTDMSSMFFNTSALTTLNLSSFNTANVTTMYGMFNGASSLTGLNLSNFNTANVSVMNALFVGTTALVTLNTTGWDLTLASGSTDVFTNSNVALAVTCNQGGGPGTGTFFGKTCQ